MMKSIHPIVRVTCLAGLVLAQVCIAKNVPVSYSKLLREVIQQAEMTHVGIRELAGPVPGIEMPGGMCGTCDIPFMSGDSRALVKKEAVPYLLDVIRNGPDWSNEYTGTRRLIPHVARCYAVLCLASTQDAQAYPVLIDLLKHGQCLFDSKVLKEEILHTYDGRPFDMEGGIRNDPNKIISFANSKTQEFDQDYNIRSYAAAGLGILGDTRAVDILTDSLDDENFNVRCNCIYALARMDISGDNRVVDSLIAALDDKNSRVRHACMHGLAKIGDVRAIGPILDAGIKFKTEDWAVVDICMQTITKIRIGGWKLFTYLNFPEPDDIQLEGYPSLKAWSCWYKNGKTRTERKFEENYTIYKHDANKDNRKKVADLGIAVLPQLIKKIEQGESDLIPLVAELTDNEVNQDAKAEEVINWWTENKATWQIFD